MLEFLRRDFRSQLPELLPESAGSRLTSRGSRKQRSILPLRQFDSSREGACQQGRANQSFVMIIDLVVKARHPFDVLAHHSIEIDRATIGVNDPRPDDLQAILSVGNLGIVDTNYPRSLGNKQILARRRVVDVRADQSFHLARADRN